MDAADDISALSTEVAALGTGSAGQDDSLVRMPAPPPPSDEQARRARIVARAAEIDQMDDDESLFKTEDTPLNRRRKPTHRKDSDDATPLDQRSTSESDESEEARRSISV